MDVPVSLGHLFGDELCAFDRRVGDDQGDPQGKSTLPSHTHDSFLLEIFIDEPRKCPIVPQFSPAIV
jgi:hypothetical protein